MTATKPTPTAAARPAPASAAALRDALAAAYAQHGAGQFERAEAMAIDILRLDPRNAHALHLAGEVALRRGDAARAVALVGEALKVLPRYAEAHNTLALALRRVGRTDDAGKHLRNAIRIKPDLILAHLNLADLMMAAGQFEEALRPLRKVLQLQPVHPDALMKLGIALFQLGRHDEAVTKMRELVALQPGSPSALSNLAMALVTVKRADEAKACAEQALALKPDFQPALTNLGQALSLLGDIDGAAAAHEKALALEPARADLYANRAVALIEQGQVPDAIAVLRAALQRFPDYYPALNNLGGALLMSQNFAEGWQLCDRVWQHTNNAQWRARYPWPLWNGEEMGGKSLLVWAEQGIGDVILFASMLPDLLTRDMKITLEVDARLVPLFQRSFPAIRVIARTDDLPAGPFDAQVNIGRLGLFLRPDRASFAGHKPFLVPDPARVAAFKARYAQLHPGPKIGIAWRSNSPSYRRKSIGLDSWAPLLARQDLCFVSLQYGEVADDLRQAKDKLGADIVHDTSFDTWGDLDGLAAQIAALDAVVSVSNLNVHIAGAVGIPAEVLLTSNALWYWTQNDAKTPWYPSLTLHRQRSFATVEAMLQHIAGCFVGPA